MSVATDHGKCHDWHELFPQVRALDHCKCHDGEYCRVYPPSTLPTDAERAQARAEHLAAIADCFELDLDGDKPVVRLDWMGPPSFLPPGTVIHGVADLDEARAIRDRLAELIEDAESGDELTPDESSRQDDIEAGFDLRDLDAEAPR